MEFTEKYKPRQWKEMALTSDAVKLIPKMYNENNLPNVIGLFGSKGLGKTSTAHLTYKMLNCKSEGKTKPCLECESCLDKENSNLFMVNAAATGGKAAIIELSDDMLNRLYHPIKHVKYVYIIDEAHKLTNDAQNTLLVTLDHITESKTDDLHIIFCTDQEGKLIGTLKDRIEGFRFHNMNRNDAKEFADKILSSEGLSVDNEKMKQIISRCEFSPRLIVKAIQKIKSGGEIIKRVTQEEDSVTSSEHRNVITAVIRTAFNKGLSINQIDRIKDAVVDFVNDNGAEKVRIIIYSALQSALLNRDNLSRDSYIKVLEIMSKFSQPDYNNPIADKSMVTKIIAVLISKCLKGD